MSLRSIGGSGTEHSCAGPPPGFGCVPLGSPWALWTSYAPAFALLNAINTTLWRRRRAVAVSLRQGSRAAAGVCWGGGGFDQWSVPHRTLWRLSLSHADEAGAAVAGGRFYPTLLPQQPALLLCALGRGPANSAHCGRRPHMRTHAHTQTHTNTRTHRQAHK